MANPFFSGAFFDGGFFGTILIYDGHDGKPFKEKKPKWQHDKEHNDKRRATIAESIYGKPVVVAKKIASLAEIQTTDDDEESVLMLML